MNDIVKQKPDLKAPAKENVNRPKTASIIGKALSKKVKMMFPQPPTKKQMSREDINVAMHNYYDELTQYYTRLREIDPRTGIERQMRINIEFFFADNMAILPEADKRNYNALLQTFETARKNNGRIIRDSEGSGGLGEFFSQENFIKRVCLHKFFITKSKVQNKATLTQYFNSLSATEKARNFVDWDARFKQANY